jgi:hypothetical protein
LGLYNQQVLTPENAFENMSTATFHVKQSISAAIVFMQREGNKFVEKIRFFTEFTLRKACVFRMANLLGFFE